TLPVFRAAVATPVHAHPERRTLIVGRENRRGLLAPVGSECGYEPARMRRAHGDVAIDLRTELRVLALTTSQHCVDQSRCARMAQQTCRFDPFANRRGLGEIR